MHDSIINHNCSLKLGHATPPSCEILKLFSESIIILELFQLRERDASWKGSKMRKDDALKDDIGTGKMIYLGNL